MEIVIPNLKGVPYDPVPDVIVMLFDKKESYPYYKEYQNYTLE